MIGEARLKEINVYYMAKWKLGDVIKIYKQWEDISMGSPGDFWQAVLQTGRSMMESNGNFRQDEDKGIR